MQWALLAKIADPAAGAPVWLSLVLQGGSFMVLVYLFIIVIPKMRKEIETERQADIKVWTDQVAVYRADSDKHRAENMTREQEREKSAREERTGFVAALTRLTDNFRAEVEAIRKAGQDALKDERIVCEKHFSTLADAMSKGNETTIQAVKTISDQAQQHAIRSQQWVEMMKQELERKTGITVVELKALQEKDRT